MAGMKSLIIGIGTVLFPFMLSAQALKPVSVSYENLMRCFPELQDEQLSFKVDLARLKDIMDEKFVTSSSQLQERKVHYLSSDKKMMNLILRMRVKAGKKVDTELSLQEVDDKGVVTNILLTQNQKMNPSQDMINNFLLNSTIKSDEYSYIDTKLNGVSSTYRRNFKDIMEIDLVDEPGRRSIGCEKKSDLGIICTCSKK